MQFDEVDKATIQAVEKHLEVIFSILSSRCGVTQAYQRPFCGPNWAPAHIYFGGQDSLFSPITGQFILTNHKTVYSD